MQRVPVKHSLELVDRGPEHRHRWLPRCACGHRFVPLRDRGRASEAYRAHVASAARAEKNAAATIRRVKRSGKQQTGRRTRTSQAGPKPLTPWADLPPELQ